MSRILIVQALWFLFTIKVQAAPHLTAEGYCFKPLAPLLTPRQEHGVTAVGNDIYLIGGIGNGSAINTIEIYNIKTNSSSMGPPLPISYHHPNVATVDGKLYVLGGITGAGGWKASAKSYLLDPSSPNKAWKEIADVPVARGSAVVGVHGKTIWLAGGEQNKPGGDPTAKGSGNMLPLDTVTSYDTTSNKWTTHDNIPLPEAREHTGAAVIDDIFYAVAGRKGGAANNRATVFALNLTTPTKWNLRAEIPSPRGGISTAQVGKKIYTFGGEGNKATTSGVFSDVEVFDTVQNSWEKRAPMPNPRHGFGAVAVGNIIYLPGGGAKQGGGIPMSVNDAYAPC
jgi:N-acetylneuraminic acid mutarotase